MNPTFILEVLAQAAQWMPEILKLVRSIERLIPEPNRGYTKKERALEQAKKLFPHLESSELNLIIEMGVTLMKMGETLPKVAELHITYISEFSTRLGLALQEGTSLEVIAKATYRAFEAFNAVIIDDNPKA